MFQMLHYSYMDLRNFSARADWRFINEAYGVVTEGINMHNVARLLSRH